MTAVYSDRRALGSAFRPIGVFDKQIAKAYVAFLNSSFGVIQFLNRRSKKLTYPAFETGHLKTIRLPGPDKVDIDKLVRVFEEIKNVPLGRLRDCVTDQVRKALDYAVADALGVDRKLTGQWREWLSKEPTITGKRYEGTFPPYERAYSLTMKRDSSYESEGVSGGGLRSSSQAGHESSMPAAVVV